MHFPDAFCLQDLTAITRRAFPLSRNPLQQQANVASEAWFKRFGAYDGNEIAQYFSYRFDDFAGLAFPAADLEHLETCINFFFWAFSFDDLSDEGDLQSKPEAHQLGVNISLEVFKNAETSLSPKFAYAAMLHDLWKRLQSDATPGTCSRFASAAKDWMNSQVQQSRNRKNDTIPSVSEFIVMRRNTIGGAMVEAMVEYSIHIDLPDCVFQDPIIRAMSDATNDIMTWPNDILSFNKEQADGDYQNLVCCVMVERNIGLQAALDYVVQMLADRVAEYVDFKTRLPSFGSTVDKELARYLLALEHFVQGTVEWYYSPRYFRSLDITDRHNLVVPLFKPKPTTVQIKTSSDTGNDFVSAARSVDDFTEGMSYSFQSRGVDQTSARTYLTLVST